MIISIERAADEWRSIRVATLMRWSTSSGRRSREGPTRKRWSRSRRVRGHSKGSLFSGCAFAGGDREAQDDALPLRKLVSAVHSCESG